MKNTGLKLEWNLALIGTPSDLKNHSESCIKKTEQFVKKWSKNKKWKSDPKVLSIALKEYEKWEELYGAMEDEWLFYSLKQSINQNDSEISAKYNKIYVRAIEIVNKMQFFVLEISRTDSKNQKKFLESKDLKEYRHFLEKLFRSSPYILSDKEETIMNLKSKVSHSNWVNLVEKLLSSDEREILSEEGKKEKATIAHILERMNSKEKKVRDFAAKVFNELLKDHLDVAEQEFNSVLENKAINDNIRGYKSASQSRLISDDIETEVVDALVKGVSENFDIAKDFYKLKAKLMNVDKLEYHERNVEIGKITSKYPLEKAYEIVFKTFNRLDESLGKRFSEYFAMGQVDVYPKKGKRSGAFCMANRINQPVFVMLNHTNNLNDVITLAHEFGHAFHFELSKGVNPLNYDFPMNIAETASTFFEEQVIDELVHELEGEEKLALMMIKLQTDVSTIFRQIAFYNFESEIHKEFREKNYLSSKDIGEIFKKHMQSYMGDYVKQTDGSENWWLYVSHFRSFFYVYSYAWGQLVAKEMSRKVEEDGSWMSNVIRVFSRANEESPKDLLMDIGLDITEKSFWRNGTKSVKNLLEETTKLAIDLGKI